MIEVSQKADEKIQEFFKGKEGCPDHPDFPLPGRLKRPLPGHGSG